MNQNRGEYRISLQGALSLYCYIYFVAYAVARCLYVCPSRSCILSKQINIYTSSKIFHRRIATPYFKFFRTKRHGNILTGTPITGANAGGYNNIAIFDQYLVSSRVVNAATVGCYQHGAAARQTVESW